jgi:hypothetical protein
VEESKDGLQILAMVNAFPIEFTTATNLIPGITPGVKPDSLKFYFEEIHRLAGS